MGERREIARRADRALRGDDRRDAARQHRLEQGERLRRTPEAPCARLASFSAIISRVVATEARLADARGVRQHDVALQLGEVGGGDAHARQLAEAGVDAVDRLAAGEDALHRRRARRDAPRVLEGSSATAAPRQIARQSASDASPGRSVTVIVPSRRAHAAG